MRCPGGQDNDVIDAANNSARWELGSEFHWPGLPEPPLLPWPQPAVWYMLARHAVAAVAQMGSRNKRTLWLPSYFCSEVAECCRRYCEICEYRDMPSWSEPDWKSLEPRSRDIVVAVNYFGVRDDAPWKNWRKRVRCILLEDHSQDPFSVWAATSTADFAFASARKTLSIPDGAILWSPQGRKLPSQPVDGDWSGSALKGAAMIYKMEYLRGAGTDELKRRFRELQLRGEDLMRKSDISAISPSSFAYVADGVPRAWRNQRLANARHLLNKLTNVERIDCMTSRWPEGAVPFVLAILFRSRRERDECQFLLQRYKIYCPVHWVCKTSDGAALDLSARILSLPIDQRYGNPDMDRIAEVLEHGLAASVEASPRRAGQE
jgi:hypothetical protein